MTALKIVAFWLLKTEPNCWSWEQQLKDRITHWDGVRNHQAQKHMRSMLVGDQAFFYHTGTERRIVGTVKIIRAAYPDHTDPAGKMAMVDMEALKTFANPVSLADIKKDSRLEHLALVKQGRLSVVPIDDQAWDLITSWGRPI